eukprot:scaffold79963_cov19-Tisochrysis_lutea.AAC.1
MDGEVSSQELEDVWRYGMEIANILLSGVCVCIMISLNIANTIKACMEIAQVACMQIKGLNIVNFAACMEEAPKHCHQIVFLRIVS